MPWHIGEHADCSGYAVIKDGDGSVAGCHETRAEAEAQLAALYASENGSTEDGDMDERETNPNAEQGKGMVAQARALIEQALALLSETEETAPEPAPVAEADAALSEHATGRVIAIEEAETTTGLVPLTLDVAVIEPGPGNAQDKHYYPAEVLRRDAGVFKGAKMYATDHRQAEKSVGTWVSTVKACPVGFTKSGAPIARVVVHKDWFARDVRALQAEGLLDKMECSILGSGRAKKGTVDEQEYNIVEAITSADSVDWVTRAGAGGRALALAESDAPAPDGGKTVDEQTEIEVQEAETVTLREEETGEQPQETPEAEPVETTEPTDEQPTAEPEDTEPAEAALPAERIDELLSESGLSEDARRLLARPYDSEQAVQDAIAEFKRIIKRASGSGQPFAQGETAPAQQTTITEADRVARYRRVKERYGLTYDVEVDQ